MNKKSISHITFAIISLIIMIFIFNFSSENADISSNTSNGITEYAVEHFVNDYKELDPVKKADILSTAEHIIRKTAHFTIFMALGISVSFMLGEKKIISKKSGIVLIICALYACSDEIHQHFVPGRACRFTDVLIDTSGSLTGLLLTILLIKIINIIKAHIKRAT